MADRRVFLRTFSGSAALRDHLIGLTPAQRYVLLQIDGVRDAEGILESTADLGDFRPVFQELEASGFVTVVSVSSPVAESPGPVPASKPSSEPAPRPVPTSPPTPAPAISSNVRLLDPAAPANEAVRQAATQAVYRMLGPDADRLVLKLEKAKKNEELLQQVTHCLQFVEGMGHPGEALRALLDQYKLRPSEGPSGSAGKVSHVLDPAGPAEKDFREAANIALYAVLGTDADPFVTRLARAKTNEDLFMQLSLDVEFIEGKGRAAGPLRRLLSTTQLASQGSEPAAAHPSLPAEPPKKSRWGLGKLFSDVSLPSISPSSAPTPLPQKRPVEPPAASPPASSRPAPGLLTVKENIAGIVRIGFGADGEAFLQNLDKAGTPQELVVAAERIRSLLQRIGREELSEAVRKELARLQGA